MSGDAITIRRAATRDIDVIVSLAIESVNTNPLPVRIDKDAIRESAIAMVSSNSQFVWVAEVAGVVVACVGVASNKSFWFHGQQASMILFWSRHPGAAVPILRKLAQWIKDRPLIKLAVIECEPQIDARTIKFLKRLGFGRESTNLVYVRGITP